MYIFVILRVVVDIKKNLAMAHSFAFAVLIINQYYIPEYMNFMNSWKSLLATISGWLFSNSPDLVLQEELADGLHLIDFEQLKIENQTYNEKIEERNEELLKLRKKITNTVQVLTHLKEKLQFVQAENTLLKSSLREVEGKVAQVSAYLPVLVKH